jgi:hypothetical protein
VRTVLPEVVPGRSYLEFFPEGSFLSQIKEGQVPQAANCAEYSNQVCDLDRKCVACVLWAVLRRRLLTAVVIYVRCPDRRLVILL